MEIENSNLHRYAESKIQIRIERLALYDKHMDGIIWVSQWRKHKIEEGFFGLGCLFIRKVGKSQIKGIGTAIGSGVFIMRCIL